MADPLAIVAATATAIKVAKKLTKFLRDIHDAPDELLALSNETWNLKLVLDDVQELKVNVDSLSSQKFDPLHALVHQARLKLDELNTMTAQWGALSQWGDSFDMRKRDRWLWLKNKRRVMILQGELRELRSDLSVAVGAQTS